MIKPLVPLTALLIAPLFALGDESPAKAQAPTTPQVYLEEI
jgi:hypothetical protein